jgi:NAD(P)-dependent dehydrogenase (short-subunit alcohol dehydrogenase family)
MMKRALITGASSGIGRATAQALLARGHEVWGTSRHLNRLPATERFHPVQLDLCDDASIEAAFAQASSEAGRLDIVINNAGSGHFGAAELLSSQEISRQFQVLFFSHVRITQMALAHMRASRPGVIVNVTSLAARLPVPFMAAYNAAKAAMAAFTMSTQIELNGSGVRLIDLQPADISTDFNDAVIEAEHDERNAAEIAKVWKIVDHNMKTAPGPELVAHQILKLIEHSNPAPRLTVGGTFQAQIAPLIFRLLSQRLRVWGLKKYYHLP